MEESDDIQVTAESKPKNNRPWALIILVIVAAGIVLWLVPEQDTPAPGTAPQESVVTPERQLTPQLGPESKPEAESESEPEAKPGPKIGIQAHPGDRARETIARLRKEGGNAGEAFAEAQRQQEARQFEDAYLLYFFAAKQGHAEAALVLGTQADPAHFDPANGVLHQADPGQAYKWYRMAADNGSTEAERRLETLIEGVKKSAAAGDEKAGRLLLQWR